MVLCNQSYDIQMRKLRDLAMLDEIIYLQVRRNFVKFNQHGGDDVRCICTTYKLVLNVLSVVPFFEYLYTTLSSSFSIAPSALASSNISKSWVYVSDALSLRGSVDRAAHYRTLWVLCSQFDSHQREGNVLGVSFIATGFAWIFENL